MVLQKTFLCCLIFKRLCASSQINGVLQRGKKVLVALPEEDAAVEDAAPTLEAVALGFTANK